MLEQLAYYMQRCYLSADQLTCEVGCASSQLAPCAKKKDMFDLLLRACLIIVIISGGKHCSLEALGAVPCELALLPPLLDAKCVNEGAVAGAACR